MVSTSSPSLYQPLFAYEDSFVWGDEWVEFGYIPLLQGVVKEPLKNALILLPVNQSISSFLETVLLTALTWKQALCTKAKRSRSRFLRKTRKDLFQ